VYLTDWLIVHLLKTVNIASSSLTFDEAFEYFFTYVLYRWQNKA
jgi:hypothetical protein